MVFVGGAAGLSGVHDLCVVGSGPAGLAVALDCADAGLSVLLLEAGGTAPSAAMDALARARIAPGVRHAPAEIGCCMALGGGLHWWGGRVVPLDAVDFVPTATRREDWPISHAAYLAWVAEAAAFLGCEPVFTTPAPAWIGAGDVAADRLERRAPQTVLERHMPRLCAAAGPEVITGARVTGFSYAAGQAGGVVVAAVHARDRRGNPVTAHAHRVVLACGGLATARLLLGEQRARPDLFGGVDGPLGRFYMGHMTGSIATVTFARPADLAAFAYSCTAGGTPARRRFTLAAEAGAAAMPNIAFWVDNPPLGDAGPGSGILSLKYLVLRAIPGQRLVSEGVRRGAIGDNPDGWRAHLANIAASPLDTLRGVGALAARRLRRRPLDTLPPVRARAGRYVLRYHAEHLPDPESRVTLSDVRDPQGVPRLDIRFRYGAADIEGVGRAHDVLEAALATTTGARLHRARSPQDQLVAVRAQASDGYHQIGLTRMSARPADGIVDPHCRVHGVHNLFIASSGVFPTSGQANPTLSIVALARRLAADIVREARGGQPQDGPRAGPGR